MIIYEAPQGSPQWHQARCQAITASEFATARSRLKRASNGRQKGDWTEAALNYAFRVAVERISGAPLDEGFETWSARRGHELESEARESHAFVKDLEIEKAGFVSTDDGKFGASVDGLIEPDGISEYKCLIAPDKLRSLLVDREYSQFTDQVQGGMWITGRTWAHFVLYCPALASCGRDLTIVPFERDDDYIEALERDLLEFDALVEQYRHQIQQAA